MSIQTVEVVAVELREAKNGKPMWTCTVDNADVAKVNLFDVDSLLRANGYTMLADMEQGQTIYWLTTPFKIDVVKSGKWYNLHRLHKREDGVNPEPPLVSSVNIPRLSATEQISMIMEYAKTNPHEVVVWDSETTGVTAYAEIISLGGVYLDSGDSTFGPSGDLFIRPRNMAAVDKTSHVHGITSNDLEDKSDFSYWYQSVRKLLHGKVWVIYNAPYDVRMLDIECANYGLPPIVPLFVVDAMELYGKYVSNWLQGRNGWRSYKLTDAVKALGLTVNDAHNAYADSIMTRDLLLAMFTSVEPTLSEETA